MFRVLVGNMFQAPNFAASFFACNSFTVATVNVHYFCSATDHSTKPISEILLQYKPDVVFVQEVAQFGVKECVPEFCKYGYAAFYFL